MDTKPESDIVDPPETTTTDLTSASLWQETVGLLSERDKEVERLKKGLDQVSLLATNILGSDNSSPPAAPPPPPSQARKVSISKDLPASKVIPSRKSSIQRERQSQLPTLPIIPQQPPLPLSSPPPPPPPHPSLPASTFMKDREASKRFVRNLVFISGGTLGWIFFIIFSYLYISSVVITSYQWISNYQSDAANQNSNASYFPRDPYSSIFPYPGIGRKSGNKKRDHNNHESMILYPMQPRATNRALSMACQMPENFTLATQLFSSSHHTGDDHKEKDEPERESSSLSIMFSTGTGLVDLRDLRYSLQKHIFMNDLDFLCAQSLGIPVCYCMMIITTSYSHAVVATTTTLSHYDHIKREWLDIIGRVNLTAISIGSTVHSHEVNSMCGGSSSSNHNIISKRFKSCSIEHSSLDGITFRRSLSGVEAVVGQQIFEIHRGLDPCESTLERTLTNLKKDELS